MVSEFCLDCPGADGGAITHVVRQSFSRARGMALNYVVTCRHDGHKCNGTIALYQLSTAADLDDHDRIANMGKTTVLLTGATGFIGLRILQGLLSDNYAVRAAVRSEAKAKWLASRIKATMNDPMPALEFSIIPDFVAEGAFESAIKDITFVIHVASPITSSDDPNDWERDFVQTAIEGSLGLLKAAAATGSVRRIVITSSMVAMLPLYNLFKDPGSVPLDAESRSKDMSPPYAAKMMAYGAGKIAALNAVEAWVVDNKPSFDVIHTCPSFVTGRDDTVSTAQELCKGSNWHSLSIILGTKYDIGKPALTCHVDDVVRCHIQALNPMVPGNQCYLISCDGSDGSTWDDAKAIVEQEFPEAVKAGILPNNGHMPSIKTRLDVRKTEEVFGFVHRSYAEQVKEVTAQYLALFERDRLIAQTSEATTEIPTDSVRAKGSIEVSS